jgi:hypothetical protein
MKKIIFFTLLLFPYRGISQCCSSNPVAGSVNIGVLSKNTLRSITFFRYSYSDKYITGSRGSDFNGVKKAYYNYLGEILSFGINQRLTLETETGYYINKTEILNTIPEITQKGWGLYNGVTTLKYGLIRKDEFEISLAAGIKYPFTKKQREIYGVRLPQTLQSSTGAFGAAGQLFIHKNFPQSGLRIFSINRIEINGTNTVSYRYGNLYTFSFFISKSINYRWTAILQVTDEARGRDIRDGKKIISSGGYAIFITPQINFSFSQDFNLSVLASMPVYRYFNGTQLGGGIPVAVTLTKDFNLGKPAALPP